MANKLDKEYSSIKATKALLKLNPEISVDQVKGYDRRARTSPFIMEHVKIIQSLTDDNESLRAQVVALQGSEAVLEEEVMKLKGWLATAHENADAKIHNESAGLIIQENEKLKEEIDDLKYDMENDLYTEEDLTELKEGWGEVLQDEIAELKAENQKIKDEHKKFDEIWKTECITEQDIIDMKRQISDQCDLIKELKAEAIDLQADHEKERQLRDKLTKLFEIQNQKLTAENRKLTFVGHRLKAKNEKLRVTDTYICGNGICKGETYEEAKRIIIEKEGYEYWELWRKRVNWGFV